MGMSIHRNIAQQKNVSKVVHGHKGILDALPFLLPALIFYGAFVLYPMAGAVELSFFRWNGFSTVTKVFVGLKNYRYLLYLDPVFWTAVKNSLIWVGLSLFVPTSLGLGFALVLNQSLPGRNVFRTMLYLPSVLAPIAVATMWRWMYDPDFGVVSYIFNTLGLSSLKQFWLGDAHFALYSIFIASVWIVSGLNMVLFLAGLQNVPQDLTDAAQVDGAGSWKIFINVVVPTLRPTFIIVIALSIINSLKVFDLVVGMTNGGPAQATQVLALWSYYQSFGNHNFGAGNAIATILLGMTLLIVIPYLIWTLRADGA